MTEFHVEAVRLRNVHKHPNADSLSIATVHDAYTVIFKTGTYAEGDLVAYVPVDSIVPDTAEWAWLAPAGAALRDKDRRIKAKRLRGVFSMGLVTDAPIGAREGQDLAAQLGITKYDPDAGNEAEPSRPRQAPRPKGLLAALRWLFWSVVLYLGLAEHFGGTGDYTRTVKPPKLRRLPGTYDIDPFRRHGKQWFQPGEIVVVTEKIHGQNASFVHDGKKLHIKSRTRWRKNDPTEHQNTWARVAKRYEFEDKLKGHPGIILFGETYGNNADMPYGVTQKERAEEGDRFAAFDAYDSNTGRWLNFVEFETLCRGLGIPMAPVLRTLAWNAVAFEEIFELSEGQSTMADHLREGFVIKPIWERTINGGQRVILKCAGEQYLTRKAA